MLRGVVYFMTMHTSSVVTDFLETKKAIVLSHQHYSPDLAHVFFSSTKIEKDIVWKKIAVTSAVYQCLKHIAKTDFENALWKWLKRLTLCVFQNEGNKKK